MSIQEKLPNGNPPPKIRDIAKYCGVSKATVSRALRDDTTQQSAETIALVKAAAQEMGYDPSRSRAARRLALQQANKTMVNNTIGIFCEHAENTEAKVSTYFMRFLEGVLVAVSQTVFELQLTDGYRIEVGQTLPTAYRSGEVDGILFTSQEYLYSRVRDLLRSEPNFGNRPVVGMVDHLDGCSAVYSDNFSVGWLAMSHLLDLGHRHVLHFVLGDGSPTDVHVLRLAAFKQAMYRRGLNPEADLSFCEWTHGKPFEQLSLNRLVQHLRAHPAITGILALNDLQAGRIYNALLSAGYRVPQDISIVGSDDCEPIIEGRENILTTVRLPLQEVGKRATQLLISRVLGEETQDRDIVLPVDLVVRASTAPPKG